MEYEDLVKRGRSAAGQKILGEVIDGNLVMDLSDAVEALHVRLNAIHPTHAQLVEAPRRPPRIRGKQMTNRTYIAYLQKWAEDQGHRIDDLIEARQWTTWGDAGQGSSAIFRLSDGGIIKVSRETDYRPTCTITKMKAVSVITYEEDT